MPYGQPLSLRIHLLTLVAVVAAPLLLFAAAMALWSAEQQQRAVETGLVDTTRAMSLAIENELQGTISALSALAAARELDADDLPAFYEQARLLRTTQQWWYSVWVGDAQGRQVLSLQRPLGETLPSLADRDYFAEVLRTKRPVVSGLIESRITGGYHVAVAVPVVRDGEVRYVLAAGYRPEGLGAILAGAATRPAAVASVVDRDFRVVSRSRDVDKWVGRRATDQYIAAVQAGAQGVTRAESLEGDAVYVAVQPVQLSGWTVGIGVPARLIEGPLQQRLAVTGVLGVLVLALALLVARWLGRRIVSPIASAARGAEALVRGAPLASEKTSVIEVMQLNAALERAAALRHEEEEARRGYERERVQMVARAEAARAEAEAASRAKDEFLAMFGHELRNPLAALSSAIDVLASRHTAQHDVKIHAILRRQTSHLTRLVDDLLDVARLVRGKVTLHRSRVNLNRVLRQALDCTQDAAEHKRHALAVTERGAVWVDGDETRLLQIAVNLVDNAIKYTPPGGHIAMRLGRDDDRAVLTVEDDGPGIASELLPHVFDLFTQGERPLDRAQGGLGLGLNIARRLTELHGGSIEAHSQPGRGARFTVRLPLASEPGTTAPSAPRIAAAARPKKILIVEDNADVRDMLQTSLEIGGHVVRTAEDASQALALCADWTPDVALLDIGLPGMDGYALARELRRKLNDAAVMLVAITGYAASADRQRARAAGFDAHLSKPVDPGLLARVLDGADAAGRPPE